MVMMIVMRVKQDRDEDEFGDESELFLNCSCNLIRDSDSLVPIA
jgi:hypothetical protein